MCHVTSGARSVKSEFEERLATDYPFTKPFLLFLLVFFILFFFSFLNLRRYCDVLIVIIN